MSPSVVGPTSGHHDSVILPGGNGGDKAHASTKRSPEGGLIRVQSEGTAYEEDGIRARFTDKGAEVTSDFIPMQLCQMADKKQKMRTGSCA